MRRVPQQTPKGLEEGSDGGDIADDAAAKGKDSRCKHARRWPVLTPQTLTLTLTLTPSLRPNRNPK